MKFLLINFVICFIFIPFAISLLATFKSSKCSASNLTIRSNFSCFVKAQRRNVGAISFKVFIIQKINHCFLDAQFFYKQKTSNYFRTIINNTINVCEFLKGTDNNPLIKAGIDIIRDYIKKEYLHPCPYNVNIQKSTHKKI